MEARYPCYRHWLAGRWLVLLRSPRLGHTCQLHHGAHGVSDSLEVDARHGRETVAAVAVDAVMDVVHSRRMLLAVLALQEPSGARVDAGGKCACITVALLDVRVGLVLPWLTAHNVGRPEKDSDQVDD